MGEKNDVEIGDFVFYGDRHWCFVVGIEADGGPLGLYMYSQDSCSGRIQRIWHGKDRRSHDAAVLSQFSRHETVTTAYNGLLLRVQGGRSVKARTAFSEICSKDTSQVLRPLVERLMIDSRDCGLTGSCLLRDVLCHDIDLCVYGASSRAAADTIRKLIEDGAGILPAYWGRRVHHRRFGFHEFEVCPRFPQHAACGAELFADSMALGRLREGIFRVDDDSAGHCFPTVLTLESLADTPLCRSGERLVLCSYEIAHAMAFSVGDMTVVRDAALYGSRDGRILIAIHTGQIECLSPL